MDLGNINLELKLRSQIESAKKMFEKAKRLALFNYQYSRRIKLDSPLILYSENQFPNLLFSSTLNTVLILDPLTSKEFIYDLDTSLPCIAPSIVNIGFNLYLIGGMNHLGIPQKTISTLSFSKSTEDEDCEYLLKEVQVNSKISLKIKRKYCAAVQIHNKIVAIGGKNREACGNFEVVHLNPNKKNIIGKITERKSWISACVLESYLYIVSSDINYIEKIDIGNLMVEKIQMNENLSKIYTCKNKICALGTSGNLLILNKLGIVEINIDLKIKVEWAQSWKNIKDYVYFIDYKNDTLINFEIPD